MSTVPSSQQTVQPSRLTLLKNLFVAQRGKELVLLYERLSDKICTFAHDLLLFYV